MSHPDRLTTVLAWLHALKYVHHVGHWLAQGPSAHGDHLLLKQLYTAVEAEIDVAGEKVVGVVGSVDPAALMAEAHSLVTTALGEPDILARSSRMEDGFQRALAAALKAGQNPGVENWLAGLADAHQGHQYLLRQRLKGG